MYIYIYHLVISDFEKLPAEHTNMREFIQCPAIIIIETFAHQSDIHLTVVHTAAGARISR